MSSRKGNRMAERCPGMMPRPLAVSDMDEDRAHAIAHRVGGRGLPPGRGRVPSDPRLILFR